MSAVRGGRGGGTRGQRGRAGPSRAHSWINIKQEGVGPVLDADAAFGCTSDGPVEFAATGSRQAPQREDPQSFRQIDANLQFGYTSGAEAEASGGAHLETQHRGPVRGSPVARGPTVSVRGKQIIQSIARANVDHQMRQDSDPIAVDTPARGGAPAGARGRGGISGRGVRARGGATPKRGVFTQPATSPAGFSTTLNVGSDASVGVTEARTSIPNTGSRNVSNGGANRRGGGGRGGAVPICRYTDASVKKADEHAVTNTTTRQGGDTFAPVAAPREQLPAKTTNISPPVAKKPRQRSVSGRYVLEREYDENALYAKHLRGRDMGGARTVNAQGATKAHAVSSTAAAGAQTTPLQSTTVPTEHTGPAPSHERNSKSQVQSTIDQHAATSHVTADHGPSAKISDSGLTAVNAVATPSHDDADNTKRIDAVSDRPGLVLSAVNAIDHGDDPTRSALDARPDDRKEPFDKSADLGYQRLPVVEHTDAVVHDGAAKTEDKATQVEEPANHRELRAHRPLVNIVHGFCRFLAPVVCAAVVIFLAVISVQSPISDNRPH